MKRLLIAVALTAICWAAIAATPAPNLLQMSSAQVALYVSSHAQVQGEHFGDQNKTCGPMVKSKDGDAHTTVALCANVNPKDGSADMYAVIGVMYYANLWNMFRSATLDNGKPLAILSDDKNFQDCDDGGCYYSDIMDVAIDSTAFARDRVGSSLGIRLEGDQHPVTLWIPAGYVAGLFMALPGPHHSPPVAAGVR